MWVNWPDVKDTRMIDIWHSESGNVRSQDPYACFRVTRERPQDGLWLGCFGWGVGVGGGMPFPGQLGCCLYLAAVGIGTWRTALGPVGDYGQDINPHHLICPPCICLQQGILQITQFSSPRAHAGIVLDPHETTGAISSPVFLRSCPHPTPPHLSFLRDSLMSFIWLIINPLP